MRFWITFLSLLTLASPQPAVADLLSFETFQGTSGWRFEFKLRADDGVQEIEAIQRVALDRVQIDLGADAGILRPARDVREVRYELDPILLEFTFAGGFEASIDLDLLLFQMPVAAGLNYVSPGFTVQFSTESGSMFAAGSIATVFGETEFGGPNPVGASSAAGLSVSWYANQEGLDHRRMISSGFHPRGVISFDQGPLSYELEIDVESNGNAVPLAVVPEPASASLAGLGLLALGAMRRRRRS